MAAGRTGHPPEFRPIPPGELAPARTSPTVRVVTPTTPSSWPVFPKIERYRFHFDRKRESTISPEQRNTLADFNKVDEVTLAGRDG